MKEDVAALVLTGDDPKLLRRIARLKQQREKEENKAQRQRDKEEKEAKARSRANRPVTVLTVKHQPTYCCLSYKRLDGLKENRKPPAAFQVKNEVQSMKSQTRLKNAINWMLMFADKKYVKEKLTGRNYSYRLGFMTLTLSDTQMHSDDFIKEHMLQPFLYWLTRYYSALYVWKAESQLNGRIHFHLTIDTFVPKNSIRAKWNKLLAKHGYCKVYQDGTNDKGNAATQIKCVLSEKKCAADIGGYMSKKDRVAKKDIEAIKNKREGYEDSMVHCKFNPDLETANQDRTWYKRVIDGRLWGCTGPSYKTEKKENGKVDFILDEDGKKIVDSPGLSNISIFLDETFSEFHKEEKIFFHQNDDIYNLGKHITEKEKKLYAKRSPEQRAVMQITDEDIERKNRFMENVFIHKHINQMKMGGKLQQLIHEEKMKRKKNFQKYFTDN